MIQNNYCKNRPRQIIISLVGSFLVLIILTISWLVLTFYKGQPTTQGQNTVISLVPASQTAAVGAEVIISVNVLDALDLFSCQISLTYDPQVLQYQSVEEGSFLNESGQAATFHIDPKTSSGVINGYAVSRVGIVNGLNGNGTLAIFRFTAIALGTSNITISTSPVGIQGTKLLNSQITAISYSKNDSSVTVGTVTPTPNITLTKQTDKTFIQVGQILTYTINYQNTGSQEAKNVLIVDAIPAGTSYVQGSATSPGVFSNGQISWNLNNVPAGNSGELNFQVQVIN